jgi:tRNA threonylcarbamoyladenosine biosynthesis protein TsaB
VTIIAPVILAFDTSSSACTAALFDKSGECVGKADELIGRGHAERLVPMIAELMDGRSAERILVGVGPGSFTGIRVAIAAAHGLAIGWSAQLLGLSSLALLAARNGAVGIAVQGGHGELFVQQFDESAKPVTELANAAPGEAARLIEAELVLGSGAAQLVAARGWGEAREAWPSAANALTLPQALRSLASKPIYARAPDARVPEAA